MPGKNGIHACPAGPAGGERKFMTARFTVEWGSVILSVNGRPVPFTVSDLPCCTERFRVKRRVRLSCQIPNDVEGKSVSIKCQVRFHSGINVEPFEETGEDLALVSYYWGDHKLSIGTLGDRKGTRYVYTGEGLEIVADHSPGTVDFYIAWLEMCGDAEERERQDIYTWFAADPSCDNSQNSREQRA